MIFIVINKTPSNGLEPRLQVRGSKHLFLLKRNSNETMFCL